MEQVIDGAAEEPMESGQALRSESVSASLRMVADLIRTGELEAGPGWVTALERAADVMEGVTSWDR